MMIDREEKAQQQDYSLYPDPKNTDVNDSSDKTSSAGGDKPDQAASMQEDAHRAHLFGETPLHLPFHLSHNSHWCKPPDTPMGLWIMFHTHP
ncbi:hypothetical protein EYF80_066720 [Liparis tanakae]|uniref:Uncharacterized protein n=1 Tax=Liparis tanakae TaxID=230148 RepID=A0A4Z2E488_9TELE|nr:hypothetical protein EYF80_066720 [Liparis tanakae]